MQVRSDVHRQGEISYIVHPRIWGQGMGTAIGRRLLAHGFGELRLCHTLQLRDGWRDSLVFSILEEEWRTSSQRTGFTR
ncbi:GNAT family protein [Streptomyces sp. NPDC007205]|uniref:GNAT family N-acetyltransferase n=1 Tax=Streptomyces sp. NPDC007205 TaxID=3154316 RepID=UPI00340AF85E